MAVTTGQALALGTLAQPSRNQPFTTAVMNKQRMDLANQAQEAKRRAEEKKLQQQIADSMEFKMGGTLPIYQDDVRYISSTGKAKAMMETDPIKRGAIISQTQLELDNIKALNDQLAASISAGKQNAIMPKEVLEIVYSPKKEANEKYNTWIKDHPERTALLSKGPTGSWFFNNVSAMPMNDILGQAATRLKQTAITDPTRTRSIGGGQNEFVLTAEPTALAQEAQAIASSKDWAANVILNDPKGYETYFNKAVNNAKQVAQRTGVEPTKDEIQQAAVLEYTANALKQKATYTERKGMPSASGQLDLGFNFGGSGQTTKGVGGGTGNRIPVIINKQTKQTADVVLGGSHSIKPTKVIGINPSGVLDARTNELVTGTTFDHFEVGDIKSTPIATKNLTFTGKGGGKITIKAGQAVPENILSGVKDQGNIEYRPMFVGTATYRDTEGKQQTRSVLVPASLTADGVVAAQSKDDAPMTASQIKAAISDAERMTAELNSRLKPARQRASTKKSGTGKTYAGLDANGNPIFK